MPYQPVAIVVVPRDRFSVFPSCLEALYKHTDVPFRLIVVAGGIDETTKRHLQQLERQKGNLRVVTVDRLLMQAEARNLAMSYVDERFCVVLENDTIVHENWLKPLLQCMENEHAAVVMPLIFWYRGVHAAGCIFEEERSTEGVTLRHKILYCDISRKQIGYPENHCILFDRHRFPRGDLFEDVEPFDVDLGLTLRKLGLTAFLEPRSMVTYAAPPRWEVCDVPPFIFRWDPRAWEERNLLFMEKWGVLYDSARKRSSYRRQQLRIGLAIWFPSRFAVELANVSVGLERVVVSSFTGVARYLLQRSSPTRHGSWYNQ